MTRDSGIRADFDEPGSPDDDAGGLSFIVSAEEKGRRLDQTLAARYPEFSRSQLAGIAKNGLALIDGRAARASAVLAAGQAVALPAPAAPLTGIPPSPEIILDVLYEDEHILAVNKPWGLAVHPGSGHSGPTLAGALLARDPRLAGVGEKFRPGLAHRLDKDTSGVLVTAKTEAALLGLSQAFSRRETKKCYLAFIKGRPPKQRGVIDSPIGRHPTLRHKMAAGVAGGREAQTIYRLLRHFPGPGISLLLLRLITGRTHQIRVHLQSLGLPVLADPLYSRGVAELSRGYPHLSAHCTHQLLHARRLSIEHPVTGQPLTLRAPWPAEFLGLFKALLAI